MNDDDLILAKAKLRTGAIDRWAYDRIEQLQADNARLVRRDEERRGLRPFGVDLLYLQVEELEADNARLTAALIAANEQLALVHEVGIALREYGDAMRADHLTQTGDEP